jgi:hypothetical protein
MKSMLVLAGLVLMGAAALPHQAAAVGCLSGAVVGGVGGHVVHHGVLGAIAGCAVGHHMAGQERRESEQRYYDQRQPPQFAGPGRGSYAQGYR